MASTTLMALVLPKARGKDVGTARTSTFNPSQTQQVLSAPAYRDHVADIFDLRTTDDARAILTNLFKNDPDVSAAVNAYMTVADVDPWYVVKDSLGVISRDGHKALEQTLLALTTRFDYTKPSGFQLKLALAEMFAEFRYMLLLRGGISAELILSKTLLPSELRGIDLNTIQWKEPQPGVYKPEQKVAGQTNGIPLDIPTFFVCFFRRNPTEIYPTPFFVSAINTIAARQQVINDLYRIMKVTGLPRMEVAVLEEVLRKNAPAAEQADDALMRAWMKLRLGEIQATLSGLTADEIFVHVDSIETKMMNEKMPGVTLDISPVINVLNAQNQAALKSVATVLGRGESGVNTASVESRIFALNAEQLNKPISSLMSQALTLAIRLQGVDAYVELGFERVELRPWLELENQRTLMQARYDSLLSNGQIDDDTYHLEMFNKIRPDNIPELSGTGFYKTTPAPTGPSPNTDPLGNSLAPADTTSSRSNAVRNKRP